MSDYRCGVCSKFIGTHDLCQTLREWLRNEVDIYQAEGWPAHCVEWPTQVIDRPKIKGPDGKYREVYVLAWFYARGAWPFETLDHVAERCGSTRCFNVEHLEDVSRGENSRRSRVIQANLRKTHCPQGHPYSGANLRVVKSSGNRQCRKCDRDRKRGDRA